MNLGRNQDNSNNLSDQILPSTQTAEGNLLNTQFSPRTTKKASDKNSLLDTKPNTKPNSKLCNEELRVNSFLELSKLKFRSKTQFTDDKDVKQTKKDGEYLIDTLSSPTSIDNFISLHKKLLDIELKRFNFSKLVKMFELRKFFKRATDPNNKKSLFAQKTLNTVVKNEIGILIGFENKRFPDRDLKQQFFYELGTHPYISGHKHISSYLIANAREYPNSDFFTGIINNKTLMAVNNMALLVSEVDKRNCPWKETKVGKATIKRYMNLSPQDRDLVDEAMNSLIMI